jgi:hypothetical protein
MTTKADYTAEEWEVLMRAPAAVGMAIVTASPSGPIGVVKEMVAVGSVLGETSPAGDSNTLISAIVADFKAGYRPASLPAQAQNIEEIKARALQTCREVTELLARKAPAPEAEGVKRWLMTAAQRVAEAAKEGGFLGIGGTRVTAAEQAVVAEIAGVLGVTA